MNINWNEAPKGTTHCDISGNNAHWLSLCEDTWRLWFTGSWVTLSHLYYNDVVYINNLVKHPEVNTGEVQEDFILWCDTMYINGYNGYLAQEDGKPRVGQIWYCTTKDDPINVMMLEVGHITDKVVCFCTSPTSRYKLEDVEFIELANEEIQ